MTSWNGRIAFVTGSGSGIGQQIALTLGQRGAAVAAADIDLSAAQATADALRQQGAKAASVTLDISDIDAWDRALADAAQALDAPVDCLVNCAGVGGGGNVVDEDPRQWRRVIEVNLIGTYYGCRAVLPSMLASGRPANIVTIASLSGLRANPGMSCYTASKFGVVGLHDTLRMELEGSNVGVTVVYPGMTNTGFVENSKRLLGEVESANKVTGVGNMLASGMNPARLAARVVDGVENGEYHVFTHGEYKDAIKDVFDERLAAFGGNADPDYREDIAGLNARIAQTQES